MTALPEGAVRADASLTEFAAPAMRIEVRSAAAQGTTARATGSTAGAPRSETPPAEDSSRAREAAGRALASRLKPFAVRHGPAAALLAGLGALAASQALDAPQAAAPLAAFGVGAVTVASGAAALNLWRRAWRRLRADRGGRALQALYGADLTPTLLTDARGAVIAWNPALAADMDERRATSSPASGGDPQDGAEAAFGAADPPRPAPPDAVERLLAPAAADITVAGEVYRMLRGARMEGRARSRGLGFAGARRAVQVERLAPDRLLWRLPPDTPEAGASAAAVLDGLGLPAVAWDGGALRPNRAARALRPDMQRLMERAGTEPPAELADDEGTPILRIAAPNAARTWLLAPDADGGRRSAAAAAAETLERLPIAIARLTSEGVLTSANEPARRLLGPNAQQGATLDSLVEGLGRSIPERVAEASSGRGSGRAEIARGRRDDRETFLQLSLTPVEAEGRPGLAAVMSDATELKTLEAQFVQSQKMQAVGQLAGGVAHDFNNLLTAIAGHTDLLLMRHDSADADHSDLMQIRQNANRAAALVRQMLAFSRKQTLRPTVINLTDTLTELSHLLNRLLGEKVRLRLDHAADLGLVRVDERQFEQVVMNLVVNARDAMPGGGEVTIRTRNAVFEREFRRDRAVVPPGDYVAVEVSDTGTGIPPDRIGQIFDPFFTTKKQGEGTGLGLSTAYGIVKQTGGFIFADSPPEEGTVFTVYLPRHEGGAAGLGASRREAAEMKSARSRAAEQPAADGKVLLVEDEAPVRSFAVRALGLRGYTVTEAESAEEALELLEDESMKVDVIVSDVVMPGMDGPSWVKEARLARPDVAVVFVSGYAEGAFRRSLDGLEDFVFLPKPYSLSELSDAIARARAGAATEGAGKPSRAADA